MKRAVALLSLALAGAAVASCNKARTEAVVVITTSGLRVPDDVEEIRVLVYDAQNPTPARWDSVYTLCTAQITTGCVTLPFTMTLIPGPNAPNDSTRVRVQARRSMEPRIDDAAIFTFSPGQSLRLDFVLYGNCLDKVDCAVTNQVCGPDRMCTSIHPTPFRGEPDLATSRPHDLGAPNAPSDMATDMQVPLGDMPPMSLVDMALGPDLYGCIPACTVGMCNVSCGVQCPCTSNTTCMGGACVQCGMFPGDPCCPGHTCMAGLSCFPAGAPTTCEPADMALPGDKLLTTWDVQTFNMSAGAPPSTFNGVSSAIGSVYAVGPGGNIWQLSATANLWTKMANTPTTTLRRVWAIAPNQVWVVGDTATVEYWNGGSWQPQTNLFTGFTGYDWLGVYASGSDVWISGTSNNSIPALPAGMVANLTGGGWHTRSDTSAFIGVFSVPASSSSEAVISSSDAQEFRATEEPVDATFAPTIVSYAIAGTGAKSRKAWGTAITQAWFVTDKGSILYFDGNTLATDRGATAGQVLNGISGTPTAPPDLWAVGNDTSVNSGTPILLHASGPGPIHTTWTQQTNLPAFAAGSTFNDVVAVGSNDLYIVGNNGSTGYIVHAH